MLNDLDLFFSQESQDNIQAMQESMDNAKARTDRSYVYPGKYVMKIASFAWEDKKTKEDKCVPSFVKTEKGALLLNIALTVDDDGTEQVPAGSSIFHNLVIVPKTKDKMPGTAKMLKPVLAALIGTDDIKIDYDWLNEHCVVAYERDSNGKYVMTKDHKMTNRVYVTVDEEIGNNGKKRNVVQFINRYKNGQVSQTIMESEQQADENSDLNSINRQFGPPAGEADVSLSDSEPYNQPKNTSISNASPINPNVVEEPY